mmetsp:Transcript_24519/g.37783  ORF Transcript_24519/g.37783 Transcript_24519/m.37783 type:complete len:1096 (+) Transcript_24519:358-3645(+)
MFRRLVTASKGFMPKRLIRNVPSSSIRGGLLFRNVGGALPCAYDRCFTTATTTDQKQKGLVVGMLRETYNKWERRAPLTPHHVQSLLQRLTPSLLSGIIVQPSSHRIFTDSEYEEAGAVLQEDLSNADLILGVKRPTTNDFMYPQKSYMFFSHVIKGQAENMPLLQYILDKRIQLFDYECIVEGGMSLSPTSTERKKKRMVAFGEYAGIAGMVDSFQALGRRLLSSGYSTPFLNCPPAYMHYDMNEMKSSLLQMGSHIAQNGLPPDLEPLVFCFTGKGGNVCTGALEMFQLLPHEMITVKDLEEFRCGSMKGPHKRVFGLVVEQEELVRYKDQAKQQHQPIQKEHYRKNPSEYESAFYDRIAPHINVLVNGMYWDERFPRLLTKDEMRNLYHADNKRLYVVADISCDVNGAVEFLERTTTIEHPYFHYDPISKEVAEDIRDDGVTVCGVDILPTEIARESSTHFGNALLPVLEDLICSTHVEEGSNQTLSTTAVPFQESIAYLPVELRNACIALQGSLTPEFKYIEALMHRPHHQPATTSEPHLLIWLDGHLFDSGLINQVLDVIENNECHFVFQECTAGGKPGSLTSSSALLRVSGRKVEDLMEVERKIKQLVNLISKAEATMACYKQGLEDSSSSFVTVESSEKEQSVLLLGAGRVSKSFAELLGRTESRNIVVAGADEDEARSVAAEASKGRHIVLDVHNDWDLLAKLIKDSDVVVSLLPASMHAIVAEECIGMKTNLVTASYESEDMRNLGERAASAGISILNEVGLDPGLDHMTAMKIIDDIHERGGTVASFSSVCGGLPAPEAANNPLLYKFSWSPLGVLSACQNDATYRIQDQIRSISGKNLLNSASSFNDAWPTLHLEVLPNRNSLLYGPKYGIENASTLFRGTLRYNGFSKIMHVFAQMGLFNDSSSEGTTWSDLMNYLAQGNNSSNLDGFLLSCANGNQKLANQAKDCLQWLGMAGSSTVTYPESIRKSFCDVLEKNLTLQDQERDMVLMHTGVEASFDDGTVEKHQSSFQIYGDDNMTAMCKTVGYTAALATDLMLDGTISKPKGLLLPTAKDIYVPILGALEKEGVSFDESVLVLSPPREQAL